MRSRKVGDMLELYGPKEMIGYFEWRSYLESYRLKEFHKVYTPHICRAECVKRYEAIGGVSIPTFLTMEDEKKGSFRFGVPKFIFHVEIASSLELTKELLPFRMYEFDQDYQRNRDPVNLHSVFLTSICPSDGAAEEYDFIMDICKNADINGIDLKYVGSDNKKHELVAVSGISSYRNPF